MCLPTTVGLDVPGPGNLVRQTTFSLEDQVAGKPTASPIPEPPGPRNWDQSAATAENAVNRTGAKKRPGVMGRFLLLEFPPVYLPHSSSRGELPVRCSALPQVCVRLEMERALPSAMATLITGPLWGAFAAHGLQPEF